MNKKDLFKRIFFYWLPLIVWAGLIFYLSNSSGLKAGLSTPNEIILRKVAHTIEFGILAILVFRLLNGAYKRDVKKSLKSALIVCFLYAVSDEYHQSFVAQRNGNFADVLVDFLGVYIFLWTGFMLKTRKLAGMVLLRVIIALALLCLLIFILVRANTKKPEDIAFDVVKEKSFEENKTGEDLRKDEIDNVSDVGSQQGVEKDEKNIENEQIRLPGNVVMDVPFSSQAPFGVWDDVHDEACEEMSLIMVKYYLDGKKLTPEIAEQEILALKDYQLEKYGHYKDSSMKEVVEIAEDYYGIDNFQIIYDFEKSEIKKQLAKGNPIIIPTAGRLLGNPNFTPPGPIYHNIVLTGYEGDTIITNDPGTRNGEDYKYSIDVVYDAIHDFEGNRELIESGRKAMIILK